MKSQKLIVLALSLAIVLTFGTWSLSFGETIGESKSKLSEVNSQKQEAAGNFNEIKAQLDTQQEEVDKLNKEVGALEGKIADTEKEVEETKVRMEERKDGLDNRLRAMYKNGSVGFVDVLLSSNNVTEFLSNVDMIKKIYSYDKETLDQLKKDHDFLESAEIELKENREELVGKQKEAKEKADKLEVKKADAQAQLDSLSAMSSEIESRIAAKQAEIDRQIAEQAARQTQTIQTNAQNGQTVQPAPSGPIAVAPAGSKLAWPTQGTITSPYGPRPNFYGNFHTGIDIANSLGTPIVAAAAGTVLETGQDAAGGEFIIIYHGNGISTAYWHMMHGSIAVSAGTQVAQGQFIASMGSTGWSTGPHLHFEVRVNGQHTNPMAYL